MECERFKKLLKSWYLQVQDEALAPARMVELMENHISACPICLMDPEARRDMEKIITLVLPKDKLKIVSRSNRKMNKDNADPALNPDNKNPKIDAENPDDDPHEEDEEDEEHEKEEKKEEEKEDEEEKI